MQKQPILGLWNVAKTFGRGDEAAIPILKSVDLRVTQGEAIAVIGPSGSGKTTLLNIMGTLDVPSSGDVTFRGQSVLKFKETALAELRNGDIGFIFQLHHLLPQCTVLENVLVPTLVAPTEPDTEDRARALLDRVGLAPRLGHLPGQLSGGERQRVAVVRALINRPALLLADEPTGSLDAKATEALAELLVELNGEQDTTLVVVTHSSVLANKMTRTLTLTDGSLKE